MNAINDLLKHASDIEKKLNYTFKNRLLLALAFVHRSFINENRDVTEHNERLEFLGDSILGLLISEYLYLNLPNTPEGELSYLKSRLVEATSCAIYVHKLALEPYLLLGKGEKMTGRGRESILSDLFEAVIGAIYLDGGLEATRKFLFNSFLEEISDIIATPLNNWKALLQDYCQKNYQQTPTYQVLHEEGPHHNKIFTVAVFIKDRKMGEGTGPSKKHAQQGAAENAYLQIKFD